MGLLSVLGFTRNSDLAIYIPLILHSDKILHFIAFFVISLFVCHLYTSPSHSRHILVCLTINIIGSIASEVIQGITPYREFDWNDVQVIPNNVYHFI